MQVSDTEIRKVLQGRQGIVQAIVELEDGIDEPSFPIDPALVAEVTRAVVRMPDREDRVADLKARVDAGTYAPTSDEIADAMIRRSIADSVR